MPNLILLLLCVKQPVPITHTAGTHEAPRGWALLSAAQGQEPALQHPQGQGKMGMGGACAHCPLWQGGIHPTSSWTQHLGCGQVEHIP